MNDLFSNLGSTLKSLRRGYGLTQKELADKMGYSLRHIQNIEHGSTDPKLSVLVNLCQFFNISPASLFPSGNLDPCCLTALDFLPVGFQISNKIGMITYVNQTATKFQGYSRQEVCGKMYIWDFLYDEQEKDELKHYLQYLIENQPRPTPYISKNKTKHGRIIPIKCFWNYLYNQQHDVIGFATSITYP